MTLSKKFFYHSVTDNVIKISANSLFDHLHICVITLSSCLYLHKYNHYTIGIINHHILPNTFLRDRLEQSYLNRPLNTERKCHKSYSQRLVAD